jgi:hypothetical protein
MTTLLVARLSGRTNRQQACSIRATGRECRLKYLATVRIDSEGQTCLKLHYAYAFMNQQTVIEDNQLEAVGHSNF